jgi:hypothetical protein
MEVGRSVYIEKVARTGLAMEYAMMNISASAMLIAAQLAGVFLKTLIIVGCDDKVFGKEVCIWSGESQPHETSSLPSQKVPC